MSGSTTNLDLMTASQAGKETTFNAFADAASPAALYGRRQSTSSGLTWGYYGGRVTLRDGTNTAIANGTLTLDASTTNYVEVDPATGTVSSNTSAFTADYWPLYSVVTGTATVTSYTDYRTGAVAGASVADVACRTITVTGEGATTATLGSELVTNGSFTGNADGWTLGADWAYGTNNVIMTNDGSSGTLSQNISVTSGVAYLVAWSQTNSITGNATITPSIGAVSGSVAGFQTSARSFEQIIVAGATGSLALTFTPTDITTTGTITVDSVSVKAITDYAVIGEFSGSSADTTPTDLRASESLSNTFLGYNSGKYNITGYSNTALGPSALWKNTSGYENVALGPSALAANTNGYQNVAIGTNALSANTWGQDNVAVGPNALKSNTSGSINVAFGHRALEANIIGYSNVSIGRTSMLACTTGFWNTAVGTSSLSGLTTGTFNVGVGASSLAYLTTGSNNVAIGYLTGGTITTGTGNTIIGSNVTGLSGSLTNNVILASGGTIRAQFDGTNWTLQGNTTHVGGIAVGNATPGSSGVAFPATAVPVADPNTLDDYEEGTWTPVVKDAAAGNAATSASSGGAYTKVGNLVQFECYLTDIDTTGMTGANQVFITGLPFTSAASYSPPCAVDLDGHTATTGAVSCRVAAASTYATLRNLLTTNSSIFTVSQLTSGSADIYLSGSYRI